MCVLLCRCGHLRTLYRWARAWTSCAWGKIPVAMCGSPSRRCCHRHSPPPEPSLGRMPQPQDLLQGRRGRGVLLLVCAAVVSGKAGIQLWMRVPHRMAVVNVMSPMRCIQGRSVSLLLSVLTGITVQGILLANIHKLGSMVLGLCTSSEA